MIKVTTSIGNRRTAPSGTETLELPLSRMRRLNTDNVGARSSFSLVKSCNEGRFGDDGMRLARLRTIPIFSIGLGQVLFRPLVLWPESCFDPKHRMRMADRGSSNDQLASTCTIFELHSSEDNEWMEHQPNGSNGDKCNEIEACSRGGWETNYHETFEIVGL